MNPRNILRHIYDNRKAILNEPLSPKAFGNNGLHLRQKLTPTEHSDSHNDLATKVISRWEPSVSPVQISVIVPNPNF